MSILIARIRISIMKNKCLKSLIYLFFIIESVVILCILRDEIIEIRLYLCKLHWIKANSPIPTLEGFPPIGGSERCGYALEMMPDIEAIDKDARAWLVERVMDSHMHFIIKPISKFIRISQGLLQNCAVNLLLASKMVLHCSVKRKNVISPMIISQR